MNNENIDHSLAIADLISEYLKGELPAEKQKMLLDWLNKNEENEAIFRSLCNEEHLNSLRKSFKHYDTNTALAKMHLQLGMAPKNTGSTYRLLGRITAVAAMLALVFSVYIFWGRPVDKQDGLSNKTAVTPGRNLATLTLKNGTVVLLHDLAGGKQIVQEKLTLIKTKEGQIVYRPAVNPGAAGITSGLTNTITTPRGGHYQVVLADGTKVWLNAATSLTYVPEMNQDGKRKVELNGEAYFEVAKNERSPFEVYSSKVVNGRKVYQQVRVLGTHFNVNAYADEPEIKTTLIEGSVRVSAGDQKGRYQHTVLLKPGELAGLRDQRQLIVAKADVSESIAWKNGLFVFNDERIGSIMRKISRWYNVDVVFEGVDQQRAFGGTISRHDEVSEVLEMLSLTGVMKFELKNRKVIVRQ